VFGFDGIIDFALISISKSKITVLGSALNTQWLALARHDLCNAMPVVCPQVCPASEALLRVGMKTSRNQNATCSISRKDWEFKCNMFN